VSPSNRSNGQVERQNAPCESPWLGVYDIGSESYTAALVSVESGLIDHFKNRKFDLRIVRLLEDHPHGSPNLYPFYDRPDDPALHQHPFLENDIRITDGRLFLKGRISWDPDPSKAVNGSSAACRKPLEIRMKAPGADRSRKELTVIAFLTLLKEELPFGCPLPHFLVDTVNLGEAFFRHYARRSMTNPAVQIKLRP